MLNKVRNYAMEKFAGDMSQVEDFMEGFEKTAASGASPNPPGGDSRSPLGQIRSGFSDQLGKGLGGLFLSLGLGGAGMIYKKVNSNHLHSQFLEALEHAIAGNHIIHEAPKEKVMQYANTLFRFAPNVATDVNVLTAVLTNAIHGDGIDPMTIKTLTDLEGRFTENDSFSPKTYI